MTTPMLLQSLIVGACVVFAAVYMLGRYAPKLIAIPRDWLAQQLEQRGHARVASWLRPPVSAGGGCHSGSDDTCGSCGSCGSAEPAKEQPLVFHRKH